MSNPQTDLINDLFSIFNPKEMNFSGGTFDQKKDGKRLTSQLSKIKALMLTGKEYTLFELADLCDASQTSVSARIRDLRNKLGYTVVGRHISNGTWGYKLINNK